MSAVEKNNKVPEIDFERNRQLQKVFKNYDRTFKLVLDKPDYWRKKHLTKFQNYTWKLMKKSLRKIPSISRKVNRYRKKLLRDIQKETENEKISEKQLKKRKSIIKGFRFKRARLSGNDFFSLIFVSSLPRGVPPTNVGECQGKKRTDA